MRTLETSIAIAAAPDAVWLIMADVVRWPDWLPTVTRVEALDGETLAVGRRYRVLQPRLRPATWVVTALDSGRSFSWDCQWLGITVTAQHELVASAATSTTVRLTVRYAGPLAPLAGWLTSSTTAGYIRQEAAALKRKVESADWAR